MNSCYIYKTDPNNLIQKIWNWALSCLLLLSELTRAIFPGPCPDCPLPAPARFHFPSGDAALHRPSRREVPRRNCCSGHRSPFSAPSHWWWSRHCGPCRRRWCPWRPRWPRCCLRCQCHCCCRRRRSQTCWRGAWRFERGQIWRKKGEKREKY